MSLVVIMNHWLSNEDRLKSSEPHHILKALQWIRVIDIKQPFYKATVTEFQEFIFNFNRTALPCLQLLSCCFSKTECLTSLCNTETDTTVRRR